MVSGIVLLIELDCLILSLIIFRMIWINQWKVILFSQGLGDLGLIASWG